MTKELAGVPYIAYGNDTLSELTKVHAGDQAACIICHDNHTLMPADDGGELLLFYKCGERTFLGAISGRLIIGVKPDYTGEA